MAFQRREFLQGAGAALGLAAIGAPAIAQSRTKVKVGYLHTPAVDGQIWTGMQMGTFGKAGLDLELVQFTTGLELFQAMIGGSLDMLATGAVISNFPARGQGKAFLINNVEFATAGPYYMEVLVDDVMKVRYPINVFVVPPPNAGQQPSTRSGSPG